MTTKDHEVIAAKIADELWPIAGDPTFPPSRSESDGWCNAFDGAMRAFRTGAGRNDVYENPSSVWEHAWNDAAHTNEPCTY